MKQLLVILLVTIITIISHPLFAQDVSKLILAAEASTDYIDPSYYGKWSWHNVHKRTANQFININAIRKIDACPNCHVEGKNKIYDPHVQLNNNGDIIKEKCLHCHLEKPDEKHASFKTNQKEIKFVRSLDVLCMGCHRRNLDFLHPVNAKHITWPSYKMQVMMETSEKEFDIILPLDFEGKIMCATCHNPHEKGVIPKEKAAAKGAGGKFRIRMTSQAEKFAPQKAGDKYWIFLPSKAGEVMIKEADPYSLIRMTDSTAKICTTCHRDMRNF